VIVVSNNVEKLFICFLVIQIYSFVKFLVVSY
jgi:hypothetical protein